MHENENKSKEKYCVGEFLYEIGQLPEFEKRY